MNYPTLKTEDPATQDSNDRSGKGFFREIIFTKISLHTGALQLRLMLICEAPAIYSMDLLCNKSRELLFNVKKCRKISSNWLTIC